MHRQKLNKIKMKIQGSTNNTLAQSKWSYAGYKSGNSSCNTLKPWCICIRAPITRGFDNIRRFSGLESCIHRSQSIEPNPQTSQITVLIYSFDSYDITASAHFKYSFSYIGIERKLGQ